MGNLCSPATETRTRAPSRRLAGRADDEGASRGAETGAWPIEERAEQEPALLNTPRRKEKAKELARARAAARKSGRQSRRPVFSPGHETRAKRPLLRRPCAATPPRVAAAADQQQCPAQPSTATPLRVAAAADSKIDIDVNIDPPRVADMVVTSSVGEELRRLVRDIRAARRLGSDPE